MSYSRPVDLHCPNCKCPIGSVDTVVGGPNRPWPGDPSMCAACGVITVYSDDMNLRIATQPDIDRLSKLQRKAIDDILKTFGTFKQGAIS